MAEFEKSRWSNSEFSQKYRNEAEAYLPFRRQFIYFAKSFYGQFVCKNRMARVLDLGCGDGLFVEELLKSYEPAEVVLVDGSTEMLQAAKERLKKSKGLRFIEASFQDMLDNDCLDGSFDFVYSSLAIHHLSFEEKRGLYQYVYDRLNQEGSFVHYDVVVPPSETLEKWYLCLWKQWINDNAEPDGDAKLAGIPELYKGNPDNTPDSLESQLNAMEEIGFRHVDCYFKCGVFSLFGGRK